MMMIERTIARAGNHGNECRLSHTGADGNMDNGESEVEANSQNEKYDISDTGDKRESSGKTGVEDTMEESDEAGEDDNTQGDD